MREFHASWRRNAVIRCNWLQLAASGLTGFDRLPMKPDQKETGGPDPCSPKARHPPRRALELLQVAASAAICCNWLQLKGYTEVEKGAIAASGRKRPGAARGRA
jgi:hypothetical protein